jgi:hypothetical protein
MLEHARPVSRREFLKGAAMATVATAAASTSYGAILRDGPAAHHRKIPALAMSGHVTGIAAVGDRLVAVGDRVEEGASQPVVWTCRLGDEWWSLAATKLGFPPGTVLASVTGIGERIVAAGHARDVSGVQTIVDDTTGRSMDLPIFASIPAIFSSADAARWVQVARGAPGDTLGMFRGVAIMNEGGRALAVGSRFLEPGVTEGYGLVAMESADGWTWESARLPGVAQPRHGSVTLVARVRHSVLLGAREVRDSKLYLCTGVTWRRAEVPARNVTYTAAAATDRGLILAGIDDSGAARSWRRERERWSEIGRLPGIPDGARLADFEELAGALVVAGSHEGTGFVRQLAE